MTTDQTGPVSGAVEALVSELEREQAWLEEMRADLTRTEHTCQRLMTAVDAALSAMPQAARRPFHVRLKRLQIAMPRLGRPPKDGRQAAIYAFIADRGEGFLTNAETRKHLENMGLSASVYYVSNLFGTLVRDGVLYRAAHGCYGINPTHPKLRSLRMRDEETATLDDLRAQMRTLKDMQNRPAGGLRGGS